MADTKSQFYAAEQFKHSFRTGSMAKFTSLLYALLNQAATDTDTQSTLTSGGKEITAAGYSQQNLPPLDANYTYTNATYQGVNAQPVVFSGMTASPAQTATHFAVLDQAGNIIHKAALPNSIVIGGSPTTITIAAGDVQIDMNG